jgi:hypothetical protein
MTGDSFKTISFRVFTYVEQILNLCGVKRSLYTDQVRFYLY